MLAGGDLGTDFDDLAFEVSGVDDPIGDFLSVEPEGGDGGAGAVFRGGAGAAGKGEGLSAVVSTRRPGLRAGTHHAAAVVVPEGV